MLHKYELVEVLFYYRELRRRWGIKDRLYLRVRDSKQESSISLTSRMVDGFIILNIIFIIFLINSHLVLRKYRGRGRKRVHYVIRVCCGIVGYQLISDIVMSEAAKRGLRERPRRKTYDSDHEETERYPYTKSYPKQQLTQAQLLNQEAKLLARFVSTINKCYQEYAALSSERQLQNGKTSQNAHNNNNKIQDQEKENKRKTEPSRIADNSKVRKTKDGPTGHGKPKNPDTANSEDFLSKMKGVSRTAASTMIQLEREMIKNKQDPAASFKSMPAGVSKGKNEIKNIKQGDKTIQKMQTKEQKLFKRSSYHVAIAYHIFLSKKPQNSNDIQFSDPTFPARRLKEQYTKPK